MRLRHVLRSQALWVAIAVISCSSSDSKNDEIVAIPFPTTIELGASDLSALEPEVGDGLLRFTTAPAVLAQVRPGQILVGTATPSTPRGLLRVVLSAARDGQGLTLRTAQAPIQLAYRKLHARLARSTAIATSAATSNSAPLQRGLTLGEGTFQGSQPFDYVLFDADGDPLTKNDQVAIDGSLGGGFDYRFGLDVDWGAVDELPAAITSCLAMLADIVTGKLPDCSLDALLPEARVTFDVHPEVKAEAHIHGAAILDYQRDADLLSKTLTPIVLGPLVFVPTVDVTASLSGGASASFTTGVRGSARFHTGVTVSSRQTAAAQFSAPKLTSTDFGPTETRVTLHAKGKVATGARLSLLLFGVTGPYANAQAFAAIEANFLAAPCWSLRAGVEAELGIKVTSPALPLLGHVTLVDWQSPRLAPLDLPLASGACEAPPDAPTLPPGSGPDAARFAMPSFVPWSRAWSPAVEGAIAASPGNGVAFSQLARTIDGHYVRAGYAVSTLTKLAERGALVWSRALDVAGARLRTLRVAPARDASMVVLSTTVTHPIVLAKVTQDGRVVDARGFSVPLDVCTVEPTSLVADGAGGHWVAGGCVGAKRSFLLHAREGAATWWLLDPGAVNGFAVRLVLSIGGEAFVAGTMNDGVDAMFAARIDRDGSVVYAKRYEGCPMAPDAIPSAGLVGAQGDVTMVGSGGAQHNATFVRLRPDGTVGFASFPGFGFGAGSVFLFDSFAELPTTGYVAGASSVQFTGEAPANVPSAGLVGLDAGGKVLWAKRYVFRRANAFEPSGHVGLELTDDGGVLATALVGQADDALGGRLWAWKAFAKDGSIAFAPAGAVAEPLAVTNLACTLTAVDRPISVTPTPMVEASVLVTATPAALVEDRQTSN